MLVKHCAGPRTMLALRGCGWPGFVEICDFVVDVCRCDCQFSNILARHFRCAVDEGDVARQRFRLEKRADASKAGHERYSVNQIVRRLETTSRNRLPVKLVF